MQSMSKTVKKGMTITPLALAIGLMSPLSQAELLDEVATGISEGTTKLTLRYRYEYVDQDGINKEANASTLKSRITYNSAPVRDFVLGIEVDNVTEVGNDNYNNTENGKTQYPVVADMEGTDLNQSFIKYTGLDSAAVTFGRQRINHGNQRFMGGVGWRQNEQTYDGVRLEYGFSKSLTADLSYIWNVNRIFGPDGADADLDGNVGAARITFDGGNIGKFTVIDYYLDFDNSDALSSNTVGIEYALGYKLNDAATILFDAAYAVQSDAGDNPTSYDADYYKAEATGKFKPIAVTLGYEVLGSDNGVGFKTPLATLHKFQGFADKFLNTPADGIVDSYVKVAGNLAGISLAAFYHDFESDKGSKDYGSEVDLVASYPINKHFEVLAKYAAYSSDNFATDTDKAWLQLTSTF